MNSGNSTLTGLATLIVGGAAGAVLGILFAPDKGSVTRRRIASKGNDYYEGLHDKLDLLIESIDEKFESLKGNSEELANAGKVKAHQANNAIKPAVKSVKAAANSVKSKASETTHRVKTAVIRKRVNLSQMTSK